MGESELSLGEEEIIRAFGKHISLTETTLKKKIDDLTRLERLIEKQLVEKVEPTGKLKAIRWNLTEKGIEIQRALQVKKAPPKGAKKSPRPPSAKKKQSQTIQAVITMEDVIQAVTNYCAPYFQRYNAQLEALSGKLNILYQKMAMKTGPLDLRQVQKAIQEVYTALNLKNNYGDVVPIPMIKEMLRTKLGGRYEESALNELLLELEERRIIDLQIASDPSKVPNAQDGIHHPQRGVIYYITWRY